MPPNNYLHSPITQPLCTIVDHYYLFILQSSINGFRNLGFPGNAEFYTVDTMVLPITEAAHQQ